MQSEDTKKVIPQLTRYISWVMDITKVLNSKVTFSFTQGHWQSCNSIRHTWFPITVVFHC